jgi:N-acetylmuramoyl-L-alanine amidase
VFKFAGITFIFCSALIFVAGCASRPGGPVPPNWSITNAVPTAPSPPRRKPVPHVIKTNPPTANVQPAPIFTWSSLNFWAAGRKLTGPREISATPLATYAVRSPKGVFTLAIGTREATWNGAEIHLGFAPEFIDGQVFVHGLDLEKNLEPLLCGPPLTFSTNRIIVIDPGHGGSNVGTHSVLDGRFEKEFTLDVAKRLKPLLETNGWTVFLTRNADVFVTNADRVVFATEHHADLYISLHFNATANRDPQTGGIETYCVTPTGMPSTLTRGYSDPWNEVLPANQFDAQNLELAVRLQSAVVHATGFEDRGVCRARFMTVLRGQHCPAVLIEAGYLSNPHEAKLIESAPYRQKLAEAIAGALK